MVEKKDKKIKIDPEKRYRLSVFRSNKAITGQIIDEEAGVTLFSGGTDLIKEKKTPIELANLAGIALAKKALDGKVKSIRYDRGKFRYHGRVKAFAEGLRQGGLKF